MLAKETSHTKMPEEATGGGGGGAETAPRAAAESFNLDGILSELGSFGKYHVVLLLLLAFRDTFLNMCNYHYVFTAADVKHRCVVPECEGLDSSFNASWVPYAVPNATSVCYRATPIGNLDLNRNGTLVRGIDLNLNASDVCAPYNFDHSRHVPCERVIYENYNSIVAEFDLGCEPWKRTLVGTVHNVGLILSSIISGFVSDRYGRKVVIVCSPLIVGLLGLIKSFSVSYWMLITLEFLEAGFGYGSASMVLSLESVSQKRRVWFSCMWDMLVNFFSASSSLIAWQIPYWRSLMRAIYAPLLVAVFYIFLVDEGVRWLLAHDRRAEAVRVLNKVARRNNVTLSSKAKDMLLSISQPQEKKRPDQEEKEKAASQPLLSALRSKRVSCRLCLVAAQLFCCTFVFNGVIINAASISGDPYLNMAAVNLVQNTTNECDEYQTYKDYYFASPPSEDDSLIIQTQCLKSPRKRERSNDDQSIDVFFEAEKRSKKPLKMSSLVGRAATSGGMSYIATNSDDATRATHLIKIEIHDVKKLAKLPADQHWKNVDLRLKYYVPAPTNKQLKKTKELIYNITKEIAESKDSKKFFFNDDKN